MLPLIFNQVYYAIRGILQEQVYHCRDVNRLKERLIEKWYQLDQRMIDKVLVSGDNNYIAVSMKMEDTLNLKFKRSVWLDYSKVCCIVELLGALIQYLISA